MCIPKLVYGLDVTNIDDDNLCLLETAHRINAKNIQNVAMTVPTPAPLATMGWLCIKSYIDMQRIMFLIRTCCLPDENMYKKVLIFRLNCLRNSNESSMKMKSPVYIMLQAVKKYGLCDMIFECIDKNDFGNVIVWKNYVKKCVWELELQQWQISCRMYCKLNIYNNYVKEIKLHHWWIFVKFYPSFCKMTASVISVLMGEQPRGMQIFDKVRCQICHDFSFDSAFHVLFECNTLDNIRNDLLSIIKDSMPDCISEHYDMLQPNGKMCFLLSGFGLLKYDESYVNAYKASAKFVFQMYKTRFELYDATRIGVS